jgi:hypothetical protein
MNLCNLVLDEELRGNALFNEIGKPSRRKSIFLRKMHCDRDVRHLTALLTRREDHLHVEKIQRGI